MWEKDLPPLTTNTLSAETYFENPMHPKPHHKILGFHDWRLMRYLPLEKEGCILYGITMFCTKIGGVSGIGAHFKLSRSAGSETRTHWTGHQLGCPIYFQVEAIEYISSVWVRYVRDSLLENPFLVVSLSFKTLLSTNSKFLING